ncbi:MAG: hypothetical protein J5845_05110 [Lachnospiraceae bacterium]|nr:hypothetical protein [Lachnospiraceae bacterium]
MRIKRICLAALSLIMTAALLSACGWKGRGASIPDDAGAKITPTEIPVTYTPTPFQVREPLVTDVNADAHAVMPLLSGYDEPVWQFAERRPIEKTIVGGSATTADFQVFHTDTQLYIRLNVQDKTRTITNQADTSDRVMIFLNEAGDKPAKYAAGDATCTILRDGRIVYGTGCDSSHMKAVGFETDNGYVVEVTMPLVAVTVIPDTEIGFDVTVIDLDGDKVVKKLAWNDTSDKTATNLTGIGTLALEKDNAGRFPKPVMDGEVEELWDASQAFPLQNPAWGDKGTEAEFRILWDTDRVYLLIDVKDNTPNSEGMVMTRKDCVEVFLCGDGTKSETYREGKDLHVRIGRDGALECGNGIKASALTYEVKGTDTGYTVEVSLPAPKASMTFGGFLGLDIHVNDSEGEGQRNRILTWSDTSLKTYTDLSAVGTINLK